MKTLGRNADNDLYLEAGGLALVHDADAQCAIIESILSTQQGELQFDDNAGIDYFGTVLQNPNNIDFWAAQVTSKIEDLDFVASVDDFEYRFEKETGTLYWTMTVTNTAKERLDLRNKKLVLDGRPGLDVDWKDIYDKPKGIEESLSMIESMRDEAQDLDVLSVSTTLQGVKDTLNRVIYDPNDAECLTTRQIRFDFVGVPLGTVIDFSNLSIGLKNTPKDGSDFYAPYEVSIIKVDKDDKGNRTESLVEKHRFVSGDTYYDEIDRQDKTIELGEEGNRLWFYGEALEEGGTTHYTRTFKYIVKSVGYGGRFSITIRGNISSLSCFDSSKPILLTSKGLAFPYLSGLIIGGRVPLGIIGEGAFAGFRNLQDIVWNLGDDSADEVRFGDRAFEHCESLKSLTWMPVSLKDLGIGCFRDCTGLVSLQGLQIAATSIPDECFKGCSSLSSVAYIPNTITELGEGAFYGCVALENVDSLPSSIERIGNECFKDCSGIATILYLPESITSIGDSCFSGCTALRSLYLPPSLSTESNTPAIGSSAFANCTSLTNVLCASVDLIKIESDTFNQETLEVYVPLGALDNYKEAVGWQQYFTEESKTIYEYGDFSISFANIPAGYKLLGASGVIESNSIWQIEYRGTNEKPQRFENTTATLPDYTFLEAPDNGGSGNAEIILTGFIKRLSAQDSSAYPILSSNGNGNPYIVAVESNLPTSLELLGQYSFARCPNLSSFVMDSSDSVPFCLGERAFWGCSTLKDISTLNNRPEFGRTIESITSEYVLDEDGNIQYGDDGMPITEEVIHYFPAFGIACFYQSGVEFLSYPTTYVDTLSAYAFAETAIMSLDGILGGEAENPVLTSLGEYCFSGCQQLSTIEAIGYTGIEALSNYCFYKCTALTSLEGIDKLAALGEHCFEGCARLDSIEPLEEAVGIGTIPAYCFADCKSIVNLEGISNIHTLGEYAFSGCTALATLYAIEAHTDIAEISTGCFSRCTGLRTLVGCWNVSTIGDSAFANCTRLLSTSGLGEGVLSIDANAFQGCVSLLSVSCVASTVPMLSGTAFPSTTIPLYVKPGMEEAFRVAPGWSSFTNVSSRSILLQYENISSISISDADKTYITTRIGSGTEAADGIWYADYGDGNGLHRYYQEYGQRKLEPVNYGEYGNYDIVLFGDIIEIQGEDTPYEESLHSNPEGITVSPFLGSLATSARTITIESSYLQKVGDFCFRNYGVSGVDGNDNSLAVTLNIASRGTIGAYAFAKDNSHSESGLIGTILSNRATTAGDYAFYKSGLDSSSPFLSLVTAGKYSFAFNPDITDLSGFGSLAEVAEGMFENCGGLTTTTGLSSITAIRRRGFADCTGLTTLQDFSTSLTDIESEAFSGCIGIKAVFIALAIPPTLAPDGFDSSTYESAPLYVPMTSVTAYSREDNGWHNFITITYRALTFTLNGVVSGQTIPAGFGTVMASGSWTIKYGNDSNVKTYTGNKVLEAYTFSNRSGVGDNVKIVLSGPITGISCTESAYPIFGQAKGKNPWLVKVEATDDMEITSFGDYVFKGCSNLEKILHTPSVVSIGSDAFRADTKLNDLSGLTAVASIGAYAFSECNALTDLYGLHSVTVVGEGAFANCTRLKYIDGLGDKVASIGANAFKNCPLEEVQMFAEDPPTIGEDAFNGILTSIPLYVRSKSLTAYQNDTAWASLFPSIRSRYLEFTLTDCPSNVVVKSGSNTEGGIVKSDTFWEVDWDSYEANGIPSKNGMVTYIPSHLYESAGNHTFRIEGAVKSIGGIVEDITTGEHGIPLDIQGRSFITTEAESAASNLLTRVAGSAYSLLEEIGDGSFLNNENLETAFVTTPKIIGKAAFAYDASLTSLDVLQSATTIGDYAFYGCSGLNAVTNLGASGMPIEIGTWAFGGIFQHGEDNDRGSIQILLSSPEEVIVDDYSFGELSGNIELNPIVYVPIDAVSAFYDSNWWRLRFKIASQVIMFTLKDVPSGTTILGLSANDIVGTSRIESDSPWVIDWGDGTKDSMAKTDTGFPAHVYAYDMNAPENIRDLWQMTSAIGGAQSYVAPTLTISISGSIKSIGGISATNSPFLAVERGKGNPYLKDITVSTDLSTLENIGNYAFQGCEALENAVGFTHVKSIGSHAFEGCTNLVNIGDKDETGFLEATSIGSVAFAGCENLMSLAAFPKALYIGVRAFENCIALTGTSGLGSYYEPKTLEEWGQEGATFGAYAFEGCSFGSIDMDAYAKPPSITPTTFPGNPASVLVFVSSKDGVYEAYRNAPVWMLYFDNIIQVASISIKFQAGRISSPTRNAEGKITRGVAIYGENGRIDFRNSFVIIDWGDGTSDKSEDSREEGKTGWVFPNHYYTDDNLSGAITVRIRGNLKRIYTADGTDVPLDGGPDDALKPFIAIGEFSDATPESALPTYQIDTNTLDYQCAIEEINFSENSSLDTIGSYCFTGFQVGKVEFGKPIDVPLTIGDCAFRNCSTLASVVSPKREALKQIGRYAFTGCNLLPNVDFMAGAKTILKGAFYQCTGIQNVDGLDAIEDIGEMAFYGCSSMQSIVLPVTLKSVADSAFEGCSNILVGITISQPTSANTIKIGNRAFFGCKGPNNVNWNVTLPSKVTQIGASAFCGCGMSGLSWQSESGRAYTLVSTNPLAEAGVFESCENLTTIVNFPSLASLPPRAFLNCSQLTGFTTVGALNSIGAYAFCGCESLLDIANILDGVAGKLDDYAFARCVSLGNVTIPDTITELGEGCFSCSSMRFLFGYYDDALMPANTADIDLTARPAGIDGFERWMTDHYGDKRFDVWYKYEAIVRIGSGSIGPQTITWDSDIENPMIGAGCFMNCTRLSLYWSNFPSVQDVPAYCFYNCRTIFHRGDLSVLPDSVSTLGRFSLAGTDLGSIGRSATGAHPLAATFAPALFLGCTELQSLDGLDSLFATVPSALPDACFYGCSALENIGALANEGIVRLGNYCFAYCTTLKGGDPEDLDISISNALVNIQVIGDGCFKGCASIVDFYGLPKVKSYPFQAFGYCNAISTIMRLCSLEESMPNVIVQGDAFKGCSGIKNITLPYSKVVVAGADAPAVGIDENGNAFESDDPFPDIPEIGEGSNFKKNATLFVPAELIGSTNIPNTYMYSEYWRRFKAIRGDETEDFAIKMTLKIPPESTTLFLTGKIDIAEGGSAVIEWGDGASTVLEREYSGTISHEYPYESTSYSVQLKVSGDVIALSGGFVKDGPAATTALCRPLFSTSEPESEQSTSNALVTGVVFGPQTNVLGLAVCANCPELTIAYMDSSDIQTIEALAFYGCSKLATLVFRSNGVVSLTSIKDEAFAYTGLSDLSFLEQAVHLDSLGYGCFMNCQALTSIEHLPSTITTLGARKTIGTVNTSGRCFFRCRNLMSLKGLENLRLTSIPYASFQSCVSLTSLKYLPSSLTSIDSLAFNSCTGITSLKEGGENCLPSGCRSIGNSAFASSGLLSIAGINDGTSLGDRVFSDTALTSLEGMANISELPQGCFADCKTLSSLEGMSSSVTSLNKGCFTGCSALLSINGLSNSITSLPAECFKGCSSLTDLTGLTPNITSLGESCFENCSALTDLSGKGSQGIDGLANTNITVLPKNCFRNCSSLSSIVYFLATGASNTAEGLPSTLGSIQEGCFSGCQNIVNIKLTRFTGNQITYIEDGNNPAFDYNTLRGIVKIYVPVGSLDFYRDSTSGWVSQDGNKFAASDIMITQ